LCKLLEAVIGIEQIVDDLPDGGNADALWEFFLQDRADAKAADGHTPLCHRNELGRQVDTEDIVAGGCYVLRQNATATAEIDNQTAIEATLPQVIHEQRCRVLCIVAES
jgi:hypothetical protein